MGSLALSSQVWAQAPATAPIAPLDWRRANEAVAEFPRGHIDVLKWEQAQARAAATVVPTVEAVGLALPTAAHAARLSWGSHRGLIAVQDRLGAEAIEAASQSQWAQLDPAVLMQVHHADELLSVSAQARKAWFQAVAAQQVLAPLQDRAEAAQAAFELGQRMVAVGNWSQLQLAPAKLAKAAAQADAVRARYAAAQALQVLMKLLPADARATGVALPPALPEIPQQLINETDANKRLSALGNQLSPGEGRAHADKARLALVAYQASLAVALGYRDDVLPTRQLMSDEMLLRYNGMLKSVWDLLTETGNLAQAKVEAIAAQRDFWLAHTDLSWSLQGGTPDALVALGGGTGGPAASAGH